MLRYAALFHFSSEASLEKDQYSESEAAQASPLFLAPDECMCVFRCVRSAGRSLPSAALRMACLHGNPTYWTDEGSTQIWPRWSNGWCQTERERARDLRLCSHVGAPQRDYDISVADGVQNGTNLNEIVVIGHNRLHFDAMVVRE